jgi:hypothetical protein
MKIVHYITVPVENCSSRHPHGYCVEGHFYESDGAVHICNETGVATGDRRTIREGEAPRAVAQKAARGRRSGF